jgi:hypothetical protein
MLTKSLALVASVILLSATAGQASARPAHSMTQHSTHEVAWPENMQDPEFGFFGFDAGWPPQADVHHYTGGPKYND